MLEADILRAGLAGLAAGVKGEGEGLVFIPAIVAVDADCWRGIDGTGGGNTPPPEFAEEAVGVACGVDAAELAFGTEIGAGVWRSLRAEGWW